ncbi:uncharacterized protein LOC131940432 [Physella acuta]|uniref:uncharacterized protein LOC131940432 n=1 Tax=Physella acuta TaxID=109671 RepID=UPI0027DC7FD8|nr:uncharacterized protein LOC131940432 [Physella acuta]XP_059155036.1 uncharacterized protein LOC131940432 [Physella acuta]XP_059155037.1 uncharacterized protein LOC131940432 [Physella acuta]XP_059155038.1 uncharacterized protein LOC131940432 [Physella acuta]
MLQNSSCSFVSSFKFISLLLCVFVLVTFIWLSTFQSSPILANENALVDDDETDDIESDDVRTNNRRRLTCVFPKVDPFDPVIVKTLIDHAKHPSLRCNGSLPEMVYLNGSQLVVNLTAAGEHQSGNITCGYQEVVMNYEKDKSHLNPLQTFTDFKNLPPSTEFIRTVCHGDGGKIAAVDYFALFPKRDNEDEMLKLLAKKRVAEFSPQETLNVLMVGIDGVPRHQFMRSMNKTYPWLMKGGNSIDLVKYTQIGKNTFPNYLPLLSGILEDEIKSWWTHEDFVDALDLIWEDFSKAGYRTLFTEDWTTIGGYHYQRRGFMKPPTAHFSRPIGLEIDKDENIRKGGWSCMNSRKEASFHLDYIKQFFNKYRNEPLYAMAFLAKLTHGDMSAAWLLDQLMFDFYEELQNTGILNNTLLITFSDHGPRQSCVDHTFNGMVERRNPYAILTFPPWFLRKYPNVRKNLKTNSLRLTTHFDVHATLQELIYFQSKKPSPLRKRSHGISLFQKIPSDRTCEDIPIPKEYCLCGQRGMDEVDSNTVLYQILLNTSLKAINSKISGAPCAQLRLEKALQVVQIILPEEAFESRDKLAMFRVRLQTLPGHAQFEATVLANNVRQNSSMEEIAKSRIEAGQIIDRLNLYKGQADCMDDPILRPFCFCKNLLEDEN